MSAKYYEPLTLRQIATLLQGAIEAGADPEKPVGLHVGGVNTCAGQVSVTTDEEYDDVEVWIGGSDNA